MTSSRRTAVARPGRTLRRWGPLVGLILLALVSRNRANAADVDQARLEPLVYDRELSTPVLSARRIPQTLQAPIAQAALTPALEAVIAASPAGTCLVVSDDGRVLNEYSPASSMVPASNQKLVTTWAALESFDPETRFRTSVRADAGAVDGVVSGNLYLVGGGDPFLAVDAWWAQYSETEARAATRLEELADAVVAAGIRTVTGSVIGDESYFDSQRTGPWAERLVISDQSGPLSALAVNENFVSWPPIFDGSFSPRLPSTNPPVDAARVFGELLAARGVTVGPPIAGVAPSTAVEVAAIESPPLLDIVTHINSYSDNFGAELLLKHIGRQVSGIGSTVAGAEAVARLATQAGLPMDGVTITDGSGLSEANGTTCRFLAALVEAAMSESTGGTSPLVSSLSIGGQRGSLVGRWAGTNLVGQVFAKTGTLNDVTALSGVVNSLSDPETSLVFSYLVNGELVGLDEAVRALQTPLVEALAAYPMAPGLEALAPVAPTE